MRLRVVAVCLVCGGIALGLWMGLGRSGEPAPTPAASVALTEAQRVVVDEHLRAAMGKVMRGDAQGAVAECDAALTIYPLEDCYRVRGIAHKRLGERAKACADLSLYMELRPGAYPHAIRLMHEELRCEAL
jgi:uncharacterized membrane protein